MKEPLDYHQIEKERSNSILPISLLILGFIMEANWIICSIRMWLGEYGGLLYGYVAIVNTLGAWVYFSNIKYLKWIHTIVLFINIVYCLYIILT